MKLEHILKPVYSNQLKIVKMKKFHMFLLTMASISIVSCILDKTVSKEDIIIENDQVKLVLAKDGYAKSLIYKPTQEECLIPGKKIPISTITQERPYQNEIKLAYPTKETTFKANSLRREGDKLIVGFQLIPWEAVIKLKITSNYIGFSLEDFDLPHGVNSRRNELYNSSYYWSGDVVPDNVDQHIKYAKMAGFRTFMIYYPSFIDSRDYRKLGDYNYRQSDYPNGRDDLTRMLNKIKNAGIVPGFHFLHSHIGRDSKYITPIPDHRLNLLKIFTLAAPIGKNDTTIYLEENPANITMTDDRRVLKIRC